MHTLRILGYQNASRGDIYYRTSFRLWVM